MQFKILHEKIRALKLTANSKKQEAAFSLVEILVAATIISVTLLAVVGIASQSIAISSRTLNTYNASLLLEEGAEAVRTIRDNNYANISGLAAGTTYCPTFSTSTNSWSLTLPAPTCAISNNSIYTRSVTITNVTRDTTTNNIATSGTVAPDNGTKLITVTVSWLEGTTTVTKTLQFYISQIF